MAGLDILCKPTSRSLTGQRIEQDSTDVALVGSARGSGIGSGSRAEADADKQRCLLPIFLVEIGPEGYAFGADLRLEDFSDLGVQRGNPVLGVETWGTLCFEGRRPGRFGEHVV